MWDELWRALALVLVIEGMGPFLAPTRWRLMMARLSQLDNRNLRTVGLVCMGLGLLAMQLMKR